MWYELLTHWNGVSLFREDSSTAAADLALYTDASGTRGYGGYFQGQWFRGDWDPSMLQAIKAEGKDSMAFKELYPIIIAAILWGKKWSRKKLLFNCDNQSTVHILNSGRSKIPVIMKLMRRLVITAAQNNFSFCALFLPSSQNSIADALSRNQMDRFRQLAPLAEALPCQLPSQVMFG